MYRNWASSPEVTKFLTWPPHASLDVTKQVLSGWIEECASPKNYNWMIVLKSLGEPIGNITARQVDDKIGSTEIGYCIGEHWWHCGIMSEALDAVLGFLFEEVGFNRIESRHDPHNPHSGDVMRKCGMTYEGTAGKRTGTTRACATLPTMRSCAPSGQKRRTNHARPF